MKFSMDKLKMIFGFILLLSLVALLGVIALFKVHEDSSYGLLPLIATLSTLAGAFANWAFGHAPTKEPEGPTPTSPPKEQAQPQPPDSIGE